MDTTERRRAETREQLRARIQREFREMAGMSLTFPQAVRLFGVDPALCGRILDELIGAGFLRRRGDGSYERTDPA